MSEIFERGAEIQKTKFEDLSPARKIEAILAAVMEPVSREYALELAGVEEQEGVDAVFAQLTPVQVTEDGVTEDRFMTPEQGRARIAEEIDMKSVHGRIGDVMLKAGGYE